MERLDVRGRQEATLRSLQLLGIFAFSYLACLLASAQTPSSVSSATSNSSLILRAVPIEQDDSTICAFKGRVGTVPLGVDFQYQGQKPLRGFVAAVYYREPGDQSGEHHQILEYQAMIQPGEKWHSIVCNLPSDADLDNVSFKVDLLAFGDRTFSGPMELRASHLLYGVFEGADFISGESPQAKLVAPTPVTVTGRPVPSDDNSVPLQFTGSIESAGSGDLLLTIEATNTGSIPVIGYEFRLSFFDHATGVFVRSVPIKTLAATASASAYLLPGASWRSAAHVLSVSSDGTPDDYNITPEIVILGDGTVLRPRHSNESDELLGMYEKIQVSKLSRGNPK
jgi:hypothetical protein